MGAAESKALGNGSGTGEGSSKAKLTFTPGTPPLQATPVYTLRNAFYGKRPVSAFTYDPAQFVLDNKQEFLPKAIKKLKTIRHPSVLRFIDCKTSSAGVHLITEQVVPLTAEYLEDITEDEILVGLYDIMVALHFLHSQCHVSHNNVQLGSIFVSNGRWVLGGMEFTGTVAESMETGLTSLLSKELVPPEHQGQPAKRTSRDMDIPHAIDMWQYGKLVETLIQDGLLHIKPTALPLDRMLNANPQKRPAGDVILESDLFARNNAVSVVRYCRLKGLDKVQNAEWSQSILPKLHMLPPSIMEKIILPQLLTQEFFAAEGFDKLYRTLFTPQPSQPLISEEAYRSQVMPFMIKLWTYRQADIRMTILRLFEVYLKAVVLGEGGSEVLGQIILPEILAGLQDADAKVYLASLCGLATAIPYALLVTTLMDTDLTKQKFSVKSLYEQTLIPQIMAFWISEDCTQESRVQLVEVVMGMWCSIYTLGLHTHVAVKDMSATLTLTLVSVLKLSDVNERVELIAKSFTKHCTNGLFCISGLLKFLPQFLLDEDALVREAAAKTISAVAFQTITLVPLTESAELQDRPQSAEGDANASSTSIPSVSSPSSTHSIHVSRIRQYCEKQQSLLPPRRPIFSRSAFAGERSLSSTSLRSYSGTEIKGGSSNNSTAADPQSSRRSSMVSQDSFMFSEQGSLKAPSLFTPSLTRTGSFSGEASIRDTLGHTSGPEAQAGVIAEKPPRHVNHREKLSNIGIGIEDNVEEGVREEDSQADTELELMKALEAAKAEMKMRQLPLEQYASSKPACVGPVLDAKRNGAHDPAAFGWDAAGGDEGDDWDADDLSTLNTPPVHSPSSMLVQPAEDEATRFKREKEKAEKQEQLRLKRDQKQQEMQAKREARRQQLAEKQVQNKGLSNGSKLAAVKVASVPATASGLVPALGRSVIQLADVPSADEKDEWDVDEDIDMSALEKQAGTVEEDGLFKDLEVAYKAPAYVGTTPNDGAGGTSTGGPTVFSGSTTSIASSNSSSLTLSNSVATISTTRTLYSPITPTTPTTFSIPNPSMTAAGPASTGSMSLKSAGPPSRGTSPVSTPKRVASPLLRTGSNASLSSMYGNGNGVAKPFTVASAVAPASANVSLLSQSSSTPSLALQVDEAALEEDGWGDDWE